MNVLLRRVGFLGAGVSAALAFEQFCLYNVDGGHRAVMYDALQGGIQPDVIGEGTHFRIPFIQTPKVIDVRMKPRVIPTRTGTKDLQQVSITLRVLARPDMPHLPKLYRQLGDNFYDRVLPSICNEVLKSVVAQFDADQLLTQRERVSRQIREALDERASDFDLILEDVSITHLTFGREFTKAIEHKQVAQQDAERSKFQVMKAEQERRANVITAEGNATAAELISDALAQYGQGHIEVRRIDAAKEIATTLARSRNVTYLPGGNSNMMMMLPTARRG